MVDNQSKRATWATDQQHQCYIECFIYLRAGQPGQSTGQPGHCPQLPRCSYPTAVDPLHFKVDFFDSRSRETGEIFWGRVWPLGGE